MKLAYKLIAIISFIYFLVIVIYTGFNITMSYIWLVLSSISIGCYFFNEIYEKDKKRIPLYLYVGLNVSYICGVLVFVILQLLIISSINTATVKELDYCIVLGTRLGQDGKPSIALTKRLDKALDYAKDNTETLIVLSGSKDSGDPVEQAHAMAKYMMDKGIELDRLYVELQSDTTTESIVYSKALIDQNEGYIDIKSGDITEEGFGAVLVAENRPKKIAIITGDFHCFRAKTIAKKVGFNSIYTIGAATDGCENLASAERTEEPNGLYVPDWDVRLYCAKPVPDGTRFVGVHAHRLGSAGEGDCNRIACRVVRAVVDLNRTLLVLHSEAGGPDAVPLRMELSGREALPEVGERVTVSVRPEDVLSLR